MQEELHQFDRLQVWELVDKPSGKNVIKLKWLWKNKKDEDQTVIRNKARLVAKGLPSKESSIWIETSSEILIYVDDIIFGSTNPKFSKRFKKLMHGRFHMSLMGEMKFFLGLQIQQSPCGIFINQAKYTLKILKKHGMKKDKALVRQWL
ncbi:uncharacterized mitochondrial protein-like protein [Tanacetum coccineum]